MKDASQPGVILVTGAQGHIGVEVCRTLRAFKHDILATDLDAESTKGCVACDFRRKTDITRLFTRRPIRAVIHLAGILPTAFRADPLAGAAVNLNGSLELLREAVNTGVKRFVFASSMSVYGSSRSARPLTECDPAIPDEPYGGSKRAVELIGDTLANARQIEFVSLRIARVVGPGTKRTSSPWRSQILEPHPASILIPFTPESVLSLVHVEDVARMLLRLIEADEALNGVYNTPAELWKAKRLKQAIEEIRGIPVELGHGDGGPTCDGGLFVREFRFQLEGLKDRLMSHGQRRHF